MSARTAQNYMSVAREFGKTGATVSYLPAGGQICDQSKLPFVIDFLERADPKEIREAGGRLRGFLRRKGYLGPMTDYSS